MITLPPIDIKLIEYQEPMMHDANIKDMIKANYQF